MLTNDATRCPYYERESENVKGRHECILPEGYLRSENYLNYVLPNNEKDCLVQYKKYTFIIYIN